MSRKPPTHSPASHVLSVVMTGGSGMLGRAWRELLESRGFAYAAPPSAELDITRPDTFPAAIPSGTQLVINNAAYTAVDDCESHEELATAVNGHGPGALAEHCKSIGATLIHYSTDYVFNGHATSPYKTTEPREPINAYGRSKAVGEEKIGQAGGRFLILRTSWLYAPWGNNFVRTMVKLGRTKDSLSVVDDQRGRPTGCEHLAAASLSLYEKGVTGIHHLTDAGECTWKEFAAVAIAADTHPDSSCTVGPCATSDFPRPAPRPPYSVLDLTETEKILGPMPDWQASVQKIVTRLELPL